jgi:hypothetical protein
VLRNYLKHPAGSPLRDKAALCHADDHTSILFCNSGLKISSLFAPKYTSCLLLPCPQHTHTHTHTHTTRAHTGPSAHGGPCALSFSSAQGWLLGPVKAPHSTPKDPFLPCQVSPINPSDLITSVLHRIPEPGYLKRPRRLPPPTASFHR